MAELSCPWFVISLVYFNHKYYLHTTKASRALEEKTATIVIEFGEQVEGFLPRTAAQFN